MCLKSDRLPNLVCSKVSQRKIGLLIWKYILFCSWIDSVQLHLGISSIYLEWLQFKMDRIHQLHISIFLVFQHNNILDNPSTFLLCLIFDYLDSHLMHSHMRALIFQQNCIRDIFRNALLDSIFRPRYKQTYQWHILYLRYQDESKIDNSHIFHFYWEFTE